MSPATEHRAESNEPCSRTGGRACVVRPPEPSGVPSGSRGKLSGGASASAPLLVLLASTALRPLLRREVKGGLSLSPTRDSENGDTWSEARAESRRGRSSSGSGEGTRSDYCFPPPPCLLRPRAVAFLSLQGRRVSWLFCEPGRRHTIAGRTEARAKGSKRNETNRAVAGSRAGFRRKRIGPWMMTVDDDSWMMTHG